MSFRILLAVGIGVTNGLVWGQAGMSPNSYVGSIAEIRGEVRLITKVSGTTNRLDPAVHRFQPLYDGDRLQSVGNGSVKIYLTFGRELETNTWLVSATKFPKPVDPKADLIEQHLVARTDPAGRARGQAPARRAVLVGINRYRLKTSLSLPGRPRRNDWTDLDGCLNDVAAMRELLLARFGFFAEDIVVLTNEHATRAGILSAVSQGLIEPSRPGDVAFFYFAGHGSQAANSQSTEADHLDETIVPADSQAGAPDIRDKEWRRLFNALLSRGASLTAIFDSCHSGSMARGYPMATKSRWLPADPRDAADGSDPGPDLKARGALILSAALPSQNADEQKDAHGVPHGAFTLAWLNVLRGVDSGESAERIFLRVKAALQAEGRRQEPVLDANPERASRTLFGEQLGTPSDRSVVAVSRTGSDGEIELQGGLAIGLNKNCELSKVVATGSSTGPRLRVIGTPELTRAHAVVVAGSATDLHPGDLFELTGWAAADVPALRVWIPPSGPAESVLRALDSFRQELGSASVIWVDDPAEVAPTHFIRWMGGQWVLDTVGESVEPSVKLGRTLRAKDVAKHLSRDQRRDHHARLFLHLPPSQALRDAIELGKGTAKSAIALTDSPADAHYLLLGRLAAGHPEYAWVAPVLAVDASVSRALPMRTDWHPATQAAGSVDEAARALTRAATKLARIKGWLQLAAPPDDGRFPYHLVLTNILTGALKESGQTVKYGERYELLLRGEPARLTNGVACRHVYVVVLDSHGQSTLLFPQTAGNDENCVPYPSADVRSAPAIIRLPMRSPVEIKPPPGVDTYILLTTDQPLPNPSVLESDGVRTRGAPGDSALATLLNEVGSVRRGGGIAVPVGWSVERLSARCAP